MDRHAIVIVGAGLAGAATAFHLARRGIRDVVLLDQEAVPGVHASGRNAAIVRTEVDDPAWRALTEPGGAMLRSGELAPYRRTGGMLLGVGDEPLAAHAPGLVGRGRWVADDGVVDVAALLAAYLEGQDVRWGVRVLAHETVDGGRRLMTTDGPVEAGVLVNAAGAWAGEVGDLPLAPLGRHLFVTAPRSDALPDLPWLWDVVHDWYARPESGGWLLSACDESLRQPGDYAIDDAVLDDLAAKLARHQPALADAAIAHRWVGHRTFAEDRRPVLGFDPRTPSLFHVAALGGHGVTTSHAVGDHAAALLAAGRGGRADLDPARLLAPAP